MKELQRGMDLTRREYSMHGHNSLLKDFIHHNETRLKKLQDDARISQVQKKVLNFELLGTDWSPTSAEMQITAIAKPLIF